MTRTKLAATALVASVIAFPVFAQTTTPNTGSNAAMPSVASRPDTTATTPDTAAPGMATTTARTSEPATPSEKNPVLTDAGNVRASKVIGSSVYNEKDEKVGSVDDIILGKNNQPNEAIISVGGFLGMGAKLVAVPYEKLKFGDTTKNSDNRVIMPAATKDQLTSMAPYHYASNS